MPSPNWHLPPATARSVLAVAAWGVCLYVGSWLVSGLAIDGYDPLTQAISETFAIGAPTSTRLLMTASLVTTGVLLVAFGPALDTLAPGVGRLPGWLAIGAGVATVLVAAAPCTAGCPGFATTPLDTLHVVFAAVGYLCLIGCPLALAHRVRHVAPRVAWASAVVGGVALVLFAASATIDLGAHGLVQRLYNTLADGWYVGAALWLRRTPARPLSRESEGGLGGVLG